MIGAIKKHKRIVAAVVILILTAVIELVCNLPAIRGGYDNLDLTKYITVEKEGNKEKYVISYSSSQKFYIKELKQQMNCADCFEQSSVKTRIDILYGMYLDCKHIGDFLYKRAQVAEILKRERREQAHVKKVTELEYHNRKHIWNTTVSISKQLTNGYGISPDAKGTDKSYAGRIDKKTV